MPSMKKNFYSPLVSRIDGMYHWSFPSWEGGGKVVMYTAGAIALSLWSLLILSAWGRTMNKGLTSYEKTRNAILSRQSILAISAIVIYLCLIIAGGLGYWLGLDRGSEQERHRIAQGLAEGAAGDVPFYLGDMQVKLIPRADRDGVNVVKEKWNELFSNLAFGGESGGYGLNVASTRCK